MLPFICYHRYKCGGKSRQTQLFIRVWHEHYQPARNHAKINEYHVLLNKGYIVRCNEQYYGFVVEMVRKPQIYLTWKMRFKRYYFPVKPNIKGFYYTISYCLVLCLLLPVSSGVSLSLQSLYHSLLH